MDKESSTDAFLGKVAGYGGVTTGIGILVMILGLVLWLIGTGSFVLNLGLVILIMGIIIWAIPYVYLYFGVKRAERLGNEFLYQYQIGAGISWISIINHALRVLEFDKTDTVIGANNQVIAKNQVKPYGYLLVESPILNNRARLPIIHRDDFLLAASIFDDSELAKLVTSKEFLVTYSPKILSTNGFSGSSHHVLHYAIVPSGTLSNYYARDEGKNCKEPEPQELFGPFVYEGEIKVQFSLPQQNAEVYE